MINVGSAVTVRKHGQECQGRLIGGAFRPIKSAGGQIIEEGEFLGYQIQTESGHQIFAQYEQLEAV